MNVQQADSARQCNERTGRLRWHAAVILLFNVVFAAWLLFTPGTPGIARTVADIVQFAGPLFAVPFCLHGLVRSRRANDSSKPTNGSYHSLSPTFLGLGVLCFALGQMVWSYYELVLHQELPLPSWADIGFLSAYPCFLAGILVLPGRSLSSALRARVILDGCMIMTATLTFSWYFILGPTVLNGGGSDLQKAVGLAYPLGDLVLIGCLLLLLNHTAGPAQARAVRLLALAFAIIIVTDSTFNLLTLRGSYATGALSDVGWPLGYMLVALSARAVFLAEKPLTVSDDGVSADEFVEHANDATVADIQLWRALLPYAIVPAVVALLVFTLNGTGDDRLEVGVYVGSSFLLGLVLLRQVFTIIENTYLNRRLGVNNRLLAEANRRLEALATIDPLTDLPNHRAMVAALDGELERAQRWGQSFAVLFLDIDHFKSLNDGYGHNVGDAALREFATVVRTTLRAVDTVGRWGGEEFMALLPQLNSVEALLIAERVRLAVATHAFTTSDVHMTCSVGVAVYPMDGSERKQLVAAADHAMYAAKHLGRNQVRSTQFITPRSRLAHAAYDAEGHPLRP